ncbi:cytochrome b/b6 domain-containing protein [Magnetovibrio sp. PR-2]|uniref:cytochrome b/b6 domain-containing protein n=1 Tax=Magnetovibrio sp. PR-2 TaxID=3120356 RepID=UPI002FCE054E
MPDSSHTAPQHTTPVWDVPTRLFHWSLVAMMAAAFLTYEFADINMTWHKWNGYGLLTLVVYRVLWGVFGSNTARFASFVLGPGAVLRYLKSPTQTLGHNPVGALMVLALLSLILVQGSMGLFTTDEILVEGPLVHLVSSDWSSLAGTIHRLGFYVIAGFAGVHVLAALFYLVVKKENLIGAMFSGRKVNTHVPPGERLKPESRLRAIFLLAFSGALVWLSVNVWTL